MKCHRIHTVWLTVMVEASVQKFPYSAGSCSTVYGVDVVYLKEKKKKKSVCWNQIFLDKPESLIVFLVMEEDNLCPVFQCENNLFKRVAGL